MRKITPAHPDFGVTTYLVAQPGEGWLLDLSLTGCDRRVRAYDGRAHKGACVFIHQRQEATRMQVGFFIVVCLVVIVISHILSSPKKRAPGEEQRTYRRVFDNPDLNALLGDITESHNPYYTGNSGEKD